MPFLFFFLNQNLPTFLSPKADQKGLLWHVLNLKCLIDELTTNNTLLTADKFLREGQQERWLIPPTTALKILHSSASVVHLNTLPAFPTESPRHALLISQAIRFASWEHFIKNRSCFCGVEID